MAHANPCTTPASAHSDWERFLARRSDLTSRMALSVCNGCDQCGGRCVDGFTVTRAEREAANAYLDTLPEAEVARVLGQTKIIPWPGADDLDITVTACRYRDLENGRCLIYPVRPTVCRLFGHTSWLPCPIEAVPDVPTDAPELWSDYLAFERRTWNGWDESNGENAADGDAAFG